MTRRLGYLESCTARTDGPEDTDNDTGAAIVWVSSADGVERSPVLASVT